MAASSRGRRALRWGLGIPSAMIPIAIAVLGVVIANGPNSASGVILAVSGGGLSVAECAIAVAIWKQYSLILTWSPPRLGSLRAALPLAGSILFLFVMLAMAVGTGAPGVVVLGLMPVGVLAIRAMRRMHWRYRGWWLPRRRPAR
jgi:hypothetical protein